LAEKDRRVTNLARGQRRKRKRESHGDVRGEEGAEPEKATNSTRWRDSRAETVAITGCAKGAYTLYIVVYYMLNIYTIIYNNITIDETQYTLL